MKKLLIYLLLIAFSEIFVSSTPCYCHQQKNTGTATINIQKEDETLEQDNVDNEIHPLNIFSFRYF